MASHLTLPAAPDEITSDWLTVALREAGVLHRGAVDGLEVEIIGEERGFTGVVARLRPRYVDLGSEGSVPISVIVKLPTAEREQPSNYRNNQQRDPAAIRVHFERCARELQFYQEIAPVCRQSVPRLYFGAADDEAARVVLILEDLPEGQAGDVLVGCTPEQVALVLEAVAPLHARWWGRATSDELRWLPRWSGNHQARQERYNRQVDPFLESFGHKLPPAVHDIIDRLRDCYVRVLATLDRAPATVIHGDLHLDNVLFQPRRAVRPVAVVDWQGVAYGPAAVDVALFVAGSLEPEQRREAEDDLFGLYHALFVEHGVTGYSAEQLRDDCRLALIRQLAGTVGWLGSVNLDDAAGRERALIEAAVGDGRLVTALMDHDAAGLLSG